MGNTLLYLLMVSIGAIMSTIPFAIYLGLSSLLNVPIDDVRLFIVLFLAVSVFGYITSFGGFTLIQKQSCGSVKNIKQIASNAAFSFGIQAVTTLLVWFITPLRNIVTSILPPEMDPPMMEALGFAYWNFWAAVFGVAIVGPLSGICN